MTYISFWYYIFVALSVILYYILPSKARWVLLLCANLAFYALFCKTGWWVLLLTVCVSYVFSLLIAKTQSRALLWIGIFASILPWLTVKYANSLLEIAGFSGMNWLVPIGISFYSLQIISYLVDIYWGKVKPQKNFAKYTLYITFFPQLIQGPIPRYRKLSKQLYAGNAFDEKNIQKGFYWIIWGFFLKLMIADQLAVPVNAVFADTTSYSGGLVFVAALLYALQMYVDFYACTTLAKGTALLFGIKLAENFNHPYFSQSIEEYWRRWHITLSHWLRDYIFYQVGGDGKQKKNRYFKLLVTFFASGLWHGTGFNYLIGCGLHGIYQILGDITGPAREKIYSALKMGPDNIIRKTIKRIGVYLLVTFSMLFFRCSTIPQTLGVLKQILTDFNFSGGLVAGLTATGLDGRDLIVLLLSVILLIFVSTMEEHGVKFTEALMGKKLPIRWAVTMGAILIIMVFGYYGYGFNAQDFIYGAF